MTVLPHELPLAQRLDYIDRIFIRHPGVQLVDQALRHLTSAPGRRREASVGYVRGYSRCGKSETLKRHIEELTGIPVRKGLAQLIDGNDRPVIYVELASGETPLGVARRILGLFDDLGLAPRRAGEPRLTERDAVQRAVDIANDNGVKLLALDEVQNLFRTAADADLAKAATMLITMQDAANFPIAVTGSPMLEELFASHEAVKERASIRTLLRPLPFRDDKERNAFRNIVEQFEKTMPFVERPGLFTEEWLPATFFTTRGRLGRLTQLVRAATTVAFEDKAQGGKPSVLNIGHVKRGFKLLHGDDPSMLGVNPWDGKKLPDIPLSVDDVSPITLGKPRGRKGRGLIDD